MNSNQVQNQGRNSSRASRPIYNLHTRDVVGFGIPDRRTSANVPHTVYVSNEVIAHLGGNEDEVFAQVKGMQNTGLMPRMGSESRPLKMRDLELYERNLEMGQRHWQYISETGGHVRKSTGYDSVWGFGFYTETGFIIVNSSDQTEFVVKN